MTDEAATPGNPALARVALRSRVRAITDGAVDLDLPEGDSALVAAVADRTAYVQTADVRGLGPALRWAGANDGRRLVLIAEAPVAPGLARRAGLLDADIDVWSARGAEVEPAVAEPVVQPPPVPAEHLRFEALMAEAGARPVDDHGMLVAEVAGLEVARVVADETEPANGSAPEPRLVVGVGQADRELQQYLHSHLDDDANLRRAIEAVARHRIPGSAAHPLTRLARQRWLRSELLDDPGLIDLSALEPVAPLRPRETVSGDEPAAAVGVTAGTGSVVVCSVGVDLDLLPEAADYRQRMDPEAELVVVVPERDRALATSALGPLVPRLRVASIPAPWDR